jgi:Bacterial pre-peptidase C-terminal domain
VGRRTSTRVFLAAVLAAVVAAALGGSAAAVSFSITPGGAPVTVTISTAGDKATATFSGTAGQRVSLDITNSTIASMKITLLKPNGTQVFTVSATKTARFVDANTLPVNGTYKLVVDPNLDYTGKVTLKLYNIPADASNTMTIGSPGTTVTTTVPGQNAFFTFSGAAGHRLSLYLNPVTVSSGTLTLKDPLGAVILGPKSFATAPTFIDPITLSQDGTYKLVLDPKGKAKGSVTLSGYDVPADTSAAYTLGTEGIGTTTVPGQRNKFTFNGTQNQRVSVEVISSDFSGTLSIVKPDFSVLASTPVGPAGGFLDTTVLPLAGTNTYTIVVDPSGFSTGDFHFTAHDLPADPSVPVTADGPPVTLTTTVAGQNAYATFTGTIGQKVTVLVSNVVNMNPAELDLLNPSGSHAIPAPATVTSAGGWTQTVTLTQNGLYKILLDPLLTNSGSADVQLFNVPPDKSGTITPGTPLTVTTTAPGQNAVYTFSGTINTRISLNLTNVTIDDLNVTVLKPDGTNLIVKTHVDSSGAFVDPVKLTSTGVYKVKIDPQSSWYGSVTVGVYVVPADTTGALTLGTPLVVSTTAPGQNATRTFSGTAGQRISFNFTNVTMTSVKVIVKAPGAAPVPTVLQRTFGTDGDFVDPITLPTGRTGTYTVTIDPQGASMGNVTLTFYNVPPDITGSTSCTTTVPGQNCKLTTTATAGTHTVTVSTNVPADPGQTQSVSITVYQGTTTTPANQIGFGTSGPSGEHFDVVFPGGTVTVVVDPFGAATGTTSYTIT